MNTKKLITALFALLAMFPAMAQGVAQGDSLRLGLEQCIAFALQNNNNLKSQVFAKESNEAAYIQSKAERLPSLNGSVSQGFSYTNKSATSSWNGNYSLNSGMTLYNGGRLTNNIEKSRLSVDQSGLQIQQTQNQLTLQIVEAFLSVLKNEELVKYQKVVLKTSEEQLAQGKQTFANGKILESDYLLLEAQFASNKFDVVNTEISRNNSFLALKKLLSLTPSQKLSIINPDTAALTQALLAPSMAEVIEKSLLALPDLQITKTNIRLAELNLKNAKAANLPTLNLNAGISTGYNDFTPGWGTQTNNRLAEQATLNLSIPIFNQKTVKTQIKQTEIRVKQAELENDQTKLDLMQTLEQQYQDYLSGFNQYISLQVKQNAYYKSFMAYDQQYRAGSITTVELLQQQTNYLNTLTQYLQAKYQLILSRKILDVYMGVPVKF